MVDLSSMEARLGLQMHLSRNQFFSLSDHLLIPISDVFIVWANCKWDNRIRGFVLDKVGILDLNSVMDVNHSMAGTQRSNCASH